MSDLLRQMLSPRQAPDKKRFSRISDFVRFEGGLPLYLIPILLGVAGILFSRQIPEPFLRTTIVMLSVVIPLLAGGNWLARIHSRGHQRIVLIIGVILLTIGAMVSVSDLSTQFSRPAPVLEIPGSISQLSRWLGMLGLLGGLFVILYSIVRREEQAGEVAEQFRRLAEQIGEGVLIATPDGTITLVNQRLLDMSGLNEEQFIGQNVLSWAEQLPLEPIVRAQRELKGSPTVEYQLKWTVDGRERYFWLQGARIRTRRGVYAGMMTTVRDITEQRELSHRLKNHASQLQEEVAERTEQLEHSEERLRKLLLNMNEGFVTIDASFRVRFANERIARLLNYAPADLIGHDLFSFVDTPSRGRLLDLIENVAHNKGTRQVQREFAMKRADGTALPVVVAVSLIEEGDAAEDRYSLVVTNVNELKEMQRELEERANQLEAANSELRMLDRAKDGFLSNVSHELRTPLTTIRGYVEMFVQGQLGEIDENQGRVLKIMDKNLNRLYNLIAEMIEFSRMEIRGVDLELGLVNFEEIVQDCIHSMAPQGLEKNIQLTLTSPGQSCLAWADQKRIAQVLIILLSNAIKFSPSDGVVSVTMIIDDGGIRLSVTDQGIGIDPAYHRRVFDKFFQVDSSLARRYEGAGIGLSIAKNIADTHGGTIELASIPNNGSTFTLVLPDSVFDVGAVESAPLNLRGKRMLCISENALVPPALAGVLNGCGVVLDQAQKGYDGLRMALETRYDIVFVQQALADIPPLSLFRKLREEGLTDHTQFAVLANKAWALANDKALDDLACRLFPVPFSPQEFVDGVAAVLDGKTVDSILESIEPAPAYVARVLVLDNDFDFTDWLSTALNKRRVECIAVESIEQTMAVLAQQPCDVLIIDLESMETEQPEQTLKKFRQAALADHMRMHLVMPWKTPPASLRSIDGWLRKPYSIEDIMDIVENAGQSVTQ